MRQAEEKSVDHRKNTVGGLIGKVSTVTHYAGIMTEETGSSFAKRLKIQAENTGT